MTDELAEAHAQLEALLAAHPEQVDDILRAARQAVDHVAPQKTHRAERIALARRLLDQRVSRSAIRDRLMATGLSRASAYRCIEDALAQREKLSHLRSAFETQTDYDESNQKYKDGT